MADTVPTEQALQQTRGFRWGEVPSTRERRLAAQVTQTDPDLGGIAGFAGTFKGNGLNTIFRPQNVAAGSATPLPNPASGPNDNILEINLTQETLSFSAPLGSIPNRGTVQGDAFLNGIPYLQTINDITDPASPVGIHFEPGVWLSVPATTTPDEPASIVRMGTIPHGTTIEAQGTYFTLNGGPQIAPVDITPFAIGNPAQTIKFPSQTATDTGTFRLPQDLTSFIAAGTITQDILDNPTIVLKNRADAQNILATTVITIDTIPKAPLSGGGTTDIAFLLGDQNAATPNANAVQMSATFWVETVMEQITVPAHTADQPVIVQGATNAGEPVVSYSVTAMTPSTEDTVAEVWYTQIQYTQTVLLNFNGLTWPHVSVATLVPNEPVPVTIDQVPTASGGGVIYQAGQDVSIPALGGMLTPPTDADPQFGGGTDNIAFRTDPQFRENRAEQRLRAGSRYANATLLDRRTGATWHERRPIRRGNLLWLQVDIGRLSVRSQVEEPVPFPDRYLPAGDLTIDVVVSSTTFTVASHTAESAGRRPEAHVAVGQFVLPGDGGPARAADGGPFLRFLVATPDSAGEARLRVAYYFRDAVVQSQLLTAEVAQRHGTGTWSLRTDYTITNSLPGVADIPARPRVAVVLNGDGSTHEIYVRVPGLPGAEPPAAGVPQTAAAASLPPALGDAVRAMRRTLASEPVAPTTVAQSRSKLITAMRHLAPLGWDLYAAVFPGLRDILYSLETDGRAILHVARPAGVTLSVPWALLYTTSIDSRYKPDDYKEVPVCPLVTEWDGSTPLISDRETRCPHAETVPHTADLLCPFGFLGFRHDIEQLSSAERPVVTITAPSGSRAVIAETTYGVNAKALHQHVAGLRDAFTRLRGIDIEEARSKDVLKRLVRADVPLIYFFCHGERPRADSPETYLGIGNREFLTPADFVGWVNEAFMSSHLRIWDQVRPLIFINACHSAELDPAALFNYIDTFVTAANAAGVIGTEVKVSQNLAMEFARRFFDELLCPGATVGSAMRSARMAFLSQGNLVGLNYTPYCWADLALAPPL